jgi:hypothetical protein
LGDDGHVSAITNAVVAREAFTGDFETPSSGPVFDLASASDGFHAAAQALSGSSYTAIAASNVGELTANLSLGSGPAALLDATDFSTMLQMPAATTGMAVTASLEALVPQAAGVDAANNGAIGQILSDALQGGGSAPSIDALLSALPGAGLGEDAGLHGLASPVTDNVPAWDMGHAGGFTFDAASIMTVEAMVLHHDAVQPVANG